MTKTTEPGQPGNPGEAIPKGRCWPASAAAAVLLAGLLASQPVPAHEHTYFDRGYIDEIWETFPTGDSVAEYMSTYFTQEALEAYRVWDDKFQSQRDKLGEKSLQYLNRHELGKTIKRMRDLDRMVHHIWQTQYDEYGKCVRLSLKEDIPFLSFADFQRAKAKFARVSCDEMSRKCADLPKLTRYARIGRCRFFPDWRSHEETLTDENAAKRGRALAIRE